MTPAKAATIPLTKTPMVSLIFVTIRLGKLRADLTMGTATYQFSSSQAGERAGKSISYVGDVDGDGLEDIVMSTNLVGRAEPGEQGTLLVLPYSRFGNGSG